MANDLMVPPTQETQAEPELNLLLRSETLDRPWWKTLRESIHEWRHPTKLPPLQLTSKPVPVKEIWGEYNYKKKSAVGSVVLHCLAVGGIVAISIAGARVVKQAEKHETVTIIAPNLSPYTPMSNKKNDTIGGGGGGGDRDKFQAPKGKLPKLAMEQITPPAMVVRNDHPKLTAEPTVVVPPQVHLAANNLPNFGDPKAVIPAGPPSNGTGSGGGIGSGSGGGVGSGEGPGVGPGRGGGIGGGVFRVGGGVSPPRPINSPEAEFSEEARKAKYQGTCLVGMIVGVDGVPREVRVLSSLGMGLDEKAIEVAKKYRFEPGMKDGHPVAVEIAVEVDFHLY